MAIRQLLRSALIHSRRSSTGTRRPHAPTITNTVLLRLCSCRGPDPIFAQCMLARATAWGATPPTLHGATCLTAAIGVVVIVAGNSPHDATSAQLQVTMRQQTR